MLKYLSDKPHIVIPIIMMLSFCPMVYTIIKGVNDSAHYARWQKQQWLGDKLDAQCRESDADCAPYREFLIKLRKEIGEQP